MNLPWASCNSIPKPLKNLIVLRRCILVMIVRKPVAILSALSLVVALIEVKVAMNSLRACLPVLTSFEALANTPPVRLTAAIMSSDSTANFPATALMEPNIPSKSLASNPNCLKIAMEPSTVLFILVKVGDKSDLAKACRATLVSLADKPACDKVLDTSTNTREDVPNSLDRRVISSVSRESVAVLLPVTCATLASSRSNLIAFEIPLVKALTKPNTVPAAILKPRKRLKAKPPTLPNSVMASLALIDSVATFFILLLIFSDSFATWLSPEDFVEAPSPVNCFLAILAKLPVLAKVLFNANKLLFRPLMFLVALGLKLTLISAFIPFRRASSSLSPFTEPSRELICAVI